MSEIHFRLTHDEFLAINGRLTEAELRVYLYLRTLDPFGDRKLEVDTAVIAEKLGIVRRTVQRVLKSLADKRLIDWEVVLSRISTHSAILGSPSDRRIAKRSQDRFSDPTIAETILGSSKRSQDRQQPLETSQGKDSTTSHTSSSFFNLSQSDRSNDFENFESEDFGDFKNLKLSLDEAIAEIKSSIPDDLNPLEIDNDGEIPKMAVKPTEVDLSRRKLEDFILQSLHISIAHEKRRAYFARFKPEDWEKWEARFKPQTSAAVNKRDALIENPHLLENSIRQAIANKDLEFARLKIESIRRSHPNLAVDLETKFFGGAA